MCVFAVVLSSSVAAATAFAACAKAMNEADVLPRRQTLATCMHINKSLNIQRYLSVKQTWQLYFMVL